VPDFLDAGLEKNTSRAEKNPSSLTHKSGPGGNRAHERNEMNYPIYTTPSDAGEDFCESLLFGLVFLAWMAAVYAGAVLGGAA
jgi:hypothetical protein